jgi:DNA topoisomerase VI subunit B
MFGRALSGTKYGVKQTRGKFGLGAKMALIWAKMSTGLPIEVSSAQWKKGRAAAQTSYFKLDIDIQRYMHWHVLHQQGGSAEGIPRIHHQSGAHAA